MHLNLKTTLSIPSLERSLNAEHPYQVGKGWDSRLFEEGVTVDLSQVRWVEPSALVMVVLLIEACVREGFSVLLRTPRQDATETEKEIVQAARRADSPGLLEKARYAIQGIERRRRAFKSLEIWRLQQALQAEHIVQAKGRISLEHEFDFSTSADASLEDPASVASGSKVSRPQDVEDGFTYEKIFPLTWIGDPNTDEHKATLSQISNYDLINFLTSVLGIRAGGISTPDARTLASVFLFELAENVAMHAKVPYGLLAVWARPPLKVAQRIFDRIIRQTFLSSEVEFGRLASLFPMVEVVLGDSGFGIPKVLGHEFSKWSRGVPQETIAERLREILEVPVGAKKRLDRDEQVMLWSLDKWSSSVLHGPERGTRGLYRIRKVVRKREGQFTIRSETVLVGLNYVIGASEPLIAENKRLARFPGTLVHLRLPVMPLTKSFVSVLPKPIGKQHFIIVDFDTATDINTAVERTIRKVSEQFQARPLVTRRLVTIVDMGFRVVERRELEDLLTGLVQVTDLTGIVVANVSGLGWEGLLEVARSIEERASATESSRRDDRPHVVRAALLVIDENGRAKWMGHEAWLCSVLDRLFEMEGLKRDKTLADLLPTNKNDQSLRDLWEQSHVIDATPSGGLGLAFNRTDIIGQLSQRMSSELQQRIKAGKPPAVYHDRIFVTPSQRLVHSYICADQLLVDEFRRRAVGSLALRVKLALLAEGTEDSTISIVTDEGKARGLADSLREHLGEAEIHPVPAYSKVGRLVATMSIPRTHQVIIFTDLISTGSLVRSLVDRVIQNNLEPCLVACVIDARENTDDHIAINGRKVPVVSLTDVDLVPSKTMLTQRKQERINPVTARPESGPADLPYEFEPDQLDSIVIASNAMYFDHIARSDWRHFTIYLDAWKLLQREEIAEVIVRAFGDMIERWRQEKGISQIDGIWYPQTLDEPGRVPTAAEVIARRLGKMYGLSGEQVHIIPRRQGTRGFIFGDVAQSSWDGVSEKAGADSRYEYAGKNVVLLDWGCITGQTAHQMAWFAGSLEAKNALIAFFVSQLSNREERTLRVVIQKAGETGVTVRFVTKCGTFAYTRNDCPYCEQKRRFGEEVQGLNPPHFLKEFVNEALDDIKLKTLL